MRTESPRTRSVLVALASAALVAVAASAWLRPLEPIRGDRWPSAAELDSLSRYLAAARPGPPLDDHESFLPAAETPPAAPAAPPEPQPSAPVRRLSAILLLGEQRLAIIDDTRVRVGDALGGGASVVTIGRDHVIVRESDGNRQTLWLPTSDEGPTP